MQIRLEGIDSPELHYAAAAQPRGTSARDALLAWLGVSGARYMADGTTLSAYSPAVLPVTMLANAVDPHGRPIAYLLREAIPPGTRRRRMSTAVLRATANHALLAAAHAYFLAHTSLPYAHRLELRDVARRARAARKGVWKHDASTRGFTLHSARSVGAGGVLIFPKLFRRCIDYLARREALGFSGSFVDWLAGHDSNASITPDRVVVKHAANIASASLICERHDRVAARCRRQRPHLRGEVT